MRAVLGAVALALAATLSVTTDADATRPVPGVVYPDLCKNRGPHAMPGVQSLLMFPMGFVRFVDPDQEPNRVGRRDCVGRVRGR